MLEPYQFRNIYSNLGYADRTNQNIFIKSNQQLKYHILPKYDYQANTPSHTINSRPKNQNLRNFRSKKNSFSK